MIIKAIRYTVYILVYVVLILISGLLNIVIFKELDWTILLSAEFWLEMVVDYTLYLTVFITIALMVYEIFGDTDAEFLKLEMSIFEMKDTLVSQPFRRDVYNHNFMKKAPSVARNNLDCHRQPRAQEKRCLCLGNYQIPKR